ncbi:MAG: DUF3089 domain-containing protein [Coriobacteriia bacterium]|nr:DUF3089 domain-containing protein [Coriobacteriia bacterium]
MKLRLSTLSLLVALFAVVMLAGCAGKALSCSNGGGGQEAQLSHPPLEGDYIEATDYAHLDNWALVAKDPDMAVDVFLLYPTEYLGGDPVASIDDALMRAEADQWFLGHGSAFETVGNVYMPYYRQVSLNWMFPEPLELRYDYMRGVPKTDVIAAFEYYLEHLSEGRPFILVAHSQGTIVLKELLFDYFASRPELVDRMIAAYALGYTITKEDFLLNPRLSFAQGADDTGVVVSFNTFAVGGEPSDKGVVFAGAMAINPISWSRSIQTAPAEANLGSYLPKEGGGYEKVLGAADATLATIGNNMTIVITTTELSPSLIEEPLFGIGSLHNKEISLYYYNLRQNAENRAARYLAENARD